MPAPTVTVAAPPPVNYFAPGILRPQARVHWSGGTGPFDVLHEWDTDPLFGAPVQDLNTGATSIDTGVPPSDLGPAGTTWYYRVRVTDTSDATFTQTNGVALNWTNPRAFRRYLHLLANVGAAFYPTDTAVLAEALDGDAKTFRRYLHLVGNVGAGFYPTDTAVLAEAVDGDVQSFRRYLYLLANVDTTTPTPHIWYLFPTYGREGWEFRIVGYGFGDTQGTYGGSVTLNGLAVGVLSWELVAQSNPNLTIDPLANIAEPVHQLIRATVPPNAESGLVIVCHDGP